jgi:hypothetical protein
VTFSAVSSVQFPDRNSIAPADFSHRYRSLGSQDSGLRTQGSGLRAQERGPRSSCTRPTTRANFNSHTNRTGTSRTCSLLLRFQAESDVWKEPLSLLSLSLLSFWTERNTQVQSPRPKPVGLATATLSQPILKPMAVVETCMFRRYSPRSSRPSLNGSCLLHRFLVNLLLERFELAQLG